MSRLHPDEKQIVEKARQVEASGKWSLGYITELITIIERLDIPLGRPRSVNEKKHGISMYGIGCRCDECREANKNYSRQYRAKRRAELRAKL